MGNSELFSQSSIGTVYILQLSNTGFWLYE